MQLSHALIFGRNIDFSSLIYTELREKIENKKKEKNVPFPRFPSLILEGILSDDYQDLKDYDVGDVFLGDNMFQRKIDKPHKVLSPSMLNVIPSDELLDYDNHPDQDQPQVLPAQETSSQPVNPISKANQ